MKVMIFGAGGYVGIPLCEELLARGHDVTAVDRWFFGFKPKGCNLITADTRYFERDAMAGYDAVIDLAGLSNDATAEIDPELTFSINEFGGQHLVEIAKEAGVRRYIYASSASVYGHGAKAGLTEKDKVNPLTAYAKSKMSVEGYIVIASSPDFETVVLRNATIYGLAPRMRFDLAVNIMTLRAWKEKLIYVMGGGEQSRPFVHVSDIVSAFVFALEASSGKVANQLFNVVGENYKIARIAQIVANMMPHPVDIHNIPDDADKRDYDLSGEKLKSLGWSPKKTIADGVTEIMGALREGIFNPNDPRFYTLQYYRSLIEWDKKLSGLKLGGKLL